MTHTGGFRIFTILTSIWGTVYGLVGPFYVVYISNISGGMEKLGIAFSIMILVQSVASYFVGRYSDRLGRKPFLLLTGLMDAAILIAFTVSTKTYQIYILQGLLGITNAMSLTLRGVILGDLTEKEKRGADIGKFNAIVGVFSGIGLALGGYITKHYGLKAIFYLGAVIIACSSLLLFFIHETRNIPEND
ncbi:MAG: MFS transporter [Nitrospirae bacterium]|nr:MFS transporter [Nitrospirota bacterium]